MTLPQVMVLFGMEYIALILLVCRTVCEDYMSFLKPILIAALVYLLLGFLGTYINMHIMSISLSIGMVFFVKVIFNKKIKTAILICIFTFFLSFVVLQTLSIIILGLYLSGPVEYTFYNGLVSMGLAVLFAKLCYLYLPLQSIMQKIKESRKYLYMFFGILVAKYFIANTIFFESLESPLVNIFLFTGFSFLLVFICYSMMKIILDKKEKHRALRIYSEFDKLPASRVIDLNDYEKHLQIIYALSLMHVDSFEKATRHIDTYLNNFEDDEVGYDSKARLLKLDNKVLAAYLYVKTKQLRKNGVNCEVNIYNYTTTSKIKTSKLLEALDILIDEALETVDKTRSDLSITLRKDEKSEDGRSVIDVANRNELVTRSDTKRMVFEEYSLKTKKVKGLRRLSTILEEYDCRFSLRDEKSLINEKYLKLRFSL